MSNVNRFNEYAAAFEETYVDNDWARLEPFFTENAVYSSADANLGFKAEGRAAVLEYLKNAVDGFDRRFASRTLALREGPLERDGAVWLSWTVTYSADGAPDVILGGTETATFDGDRIVALVDTFDAEAAQKMGAWMQEHGGKLPNP